MSQEIGLHDVVALLTDTPARRFDTCEPLVLRRGQVGTVVLTGNPSLVEVEFADRNGRTHALLALRTEHLMVLREDPDHAAA